MIELALTNREQYWHTVTWEFQKETDGEAYIWWDEFLTWLKEKYRCEYWERDEQFGGPCLVFQDEKDYLFFIMKIK
jgi:hypothetical protein